MLITSIVFGGNRPYEFKDNVHLSVIYERDLDLHRIDREVYSILDLQRFKSENNFQLSFKAFPVNFGQ